MASLSYFETPRTGWFARLAALRARLAAARKARRKLETLRSASDHVLADIGITRGDLDRALTSPIWVNPADRLIRRW